MKLFHLSFLYIGIITPIFFQLFLSCKSKMNRIVMDKIYSMARVPTKGHKDAGFQVAT